MCQDVIGLFSKGPFVFSRYPSTALHQFCGSKVRGGIMLGKKVQGADPETQLTIGGLI